MLKWISIPVSYVINRVFHYMTMPKAQKMHEKHTSTHTQRYIQHIQAFSSQIQFKYMLTFEYIHVSSFACQNTDFERMLYLIRKEARILSIKHFLVIFYFCKFSRKKKIASIEEMALFPSRSTVKNQLRSDEKTVRI